MPAWVSSVRRSFGAKNAGTLKADKWRTMATTYLPIALVLSWGEGSLHTNLPHNQAINTAKKSMYLFEKGVKKYWKIQHIFLAYFL
jgi:hypothetical protein